MICSRELLEGYMDDELDPVRKAEVKDHLAGCAGCADLLRHLQQQSGELRAMPRYALPEGLESAVRGALRREAAPVHDERWRWMAIAASVLLLVSLAWSVLQSNGRRAPDNLLAANVISSHVRSLLENHLLDVPSTDQHTVKPWFNGRLDYSPRVKDLATEGFPLTGGRLDYLAGRPVAALVYQRRKHVINLFTWPSSGSETTPASVARNGYTALYWTEAGMTYWAVSDVAASDLQDFVSAYRK
jgi:anti-sigma factor RsiW